MTIIRETASATAAFALCIALPCGGVAAQTAKQRTEFEKPIKSKICHGRSASFQDYPFSVQRLARVLEINDRPADPVHVLVVDNGFVGYTYKPPRGDGPLFLGSNNFPVAFFDTLDRANFLPFLNEADFALSPLDDPDAMKGHGTHVGGIILGGMYQAGAPKAGANVKTPDVRRLLLDNPNIDPPKPWMKMRYAPLGFGAQGAKRDPIEKLRDALSKSESADTKIVNISLARALASIPSQYRLPKLPDPVLVVLAAGNAAMHLESSVQALPAQLEDSEQLMLVGSHDADGAISHFSNYGDRVALAAPGCQIESWTDGESAPQALSGTSMSTAVVSFAAALVRSQWRTTYGAALRHRLIVSAQFEQRLSQCDRARSNTKVSRDPQECVDHGAKLDIESAALVGQDLVEFETCTGETGKGCTTQKAIGELVSLPATFSACVYPKPPLKIQHGGLTRNAAIKRVGSSIFDIVTETGVEVGARPLLWTPCPLAETAINDAIVFRVAGKQLLGPSLSPGTIRIPAKNLVRIVTRAEGR